MCESSCSTSLKSWWKQAAFDRIHLLVRERFHRNLLMKTTWGNSSASVVPIRSRRASVDQRLEAITGSRCLLSGMRCTWMYIEAYKWVLVNHSWRWDAQHAVKSWCIFTTQQAKLSTAMSQHLETSLSLKTPEELFLCERIYSLLKFSISLRKPVDANGNWDT